MVEPRDIELQERARSDRLERRCSAAEKKAEALTEAIHVAEEDVVRLGTEKDALARQVRGLLERVGKD